MFKAGAVLSSQWINGILSCPHANCDYKTARRANWHKHVRSAPAHRSGSQNVSVTLRKNVDELKKGHTLTADCINGIFKCVRDNCDMETKSRSGWVTHVQSSHTVSVTLANDVGKFEKGAELRAHRTKNGFECAHVDCHVMPINKCNWINHVRSRHKCSNPDEVESSASGTHESPPKYSNDPFILLCVQHLEVLRLSAFHSNLSMVKYEQICNYYFQSRHNSLFTQEMRQIRQELVDSGILGPLPDHGLLVQYKSIFTLWITTIIKLKDCHEFELSLQTRLDEIHNSAKKYKIIPTRELVLQEQAFYNSDCENMFTILANYTSETWPGAYTSEGLHRCLQSIHCFLNDIIADNRLAISLNALALMLLDGVENGVHFWKPANEAKKILDALLYSLLLILLTEFKISSIEDIGEYMRSFFGQTTQTFARPLFSLLSNIY